jgi:hypothetical protein
MREPIDVIEHKGYTIELWPDEDCESPREYDNLATILAESHHSELGDKSYVGRISNYDDDDELYEAIMGEYHVVMLPEGVPAIWKLRVYDADIDVVSWDRVAHGYAFVTKEGVDACGTPPELFEEVTKGEIDELNRWLNGDCYGYKILDTNGDEDDACWGFIGIEYAIEEAKASVPDKVVAKLYSVSVLPEQLQILGRTPSYKVHARLTEAELTTIGMEVPK